MKRSHASTCLLLVLISLSFLGCTPAAKPTDPPKTPIPPVAPTTDRTLSIVGEQDFAPISFEENGAVTGINPELVQETFRRLGYKVNIRLVPWKRALEMVKHGEADGLFSVYRTADREANYTFPSEPLIIEKNVFFVRKNSPITYNGDIHSLSQYTIGTIIGYNTLDQYIEKKVLTKIDRSLNVESSLNKLISGDRGVDLVVNTNYILWYTAQKLGEANSVRELEIPLTENPSYLVFTKTKDMTDIAAKDSVKESSQKPSYSEITKRF